jgi:heme exporter protein CcmD
MSEHGFYIVASYGVTFLILAALVIQTWCAMKKIKEQDHVDRK